ncbi:MAG: hypothetical protein KC933_34355 [Myxococcales bacterium]|nr:hypothetical protein [Myxococcales bacterium]
MRVQGTLRLGPALVSAPVALDAAGDVALEAVSTQGNLRCTGGLLVADDLVATATSTIADLNGCTRAAFSRVRFEGGRLGVVSTRPVVVGIEDATFVQQSGVGVALEIPGELPGTLTATRVSFVGGGRGILLRGVDAQLSDVHSEGLAGSTLDVNVPGDVPESHQAVVARGVWVEGSAVPLVRSSRDAGDRRRLSMTLSDAVLHGTSTAHPLDGLLRGGRFAELNVQRAWVRTEGPPALWTSCGTGDIEDLTLRGSATDVFRLEPGQTISARRIRVEADSRGGGLFTATDSCEAGGVMVEDIEVKGACPPCGPSDPACRCLTGLEVRSQAAVSIRRSSVSGFNTGVHLFGLGPILIEESLITDNKVGIFAPTDLDLEGVLRRVVLDGNELGLQLY